MVKNLRHPESSLSVALRRQTVVDKLLSLLAHHQSADACDLIQAQSTGLVLPSHGGTMQNPPKHSIGSRLMKKNPQMRQLTRSGIVLVIASLLAIVSGCADSTSTGEATAGSTDQTVGGQKKYRIAVIPKGTTHDFWLSVWAGAEQAAEELGNVEIIWDGPESESQKDVQINLVDGFINDQLDGICLAPIDRDGMIPVVRRAKDAGIPTLIFDSGLSDPSATISYVATDNYQGGVIAGEHMAKLLGEKGNVILLRYQEGSESTEQREEGFLETLAKYPDIKIISDEQRVTTDTVEAVRVSSSLLLTHGDKVDGIFTVCESLNKGMLKALQDKQLAGKVKFIGFDSDPQLVEAMEKRQMDGIVLQNPVKMGYEAVKNMVAHLEGETLEPVISTGEALATPENMHEDDMHALLFPEKFRE